MLARLGIELERLLLVLLLRDKALISELGLGLELLLLLPEGVLVPLLLLNFADRNSSSQ